jgi:hypothetical protein
MKPANISLLIIAFGIAVTSIAQQKGPTFIGINGGVSLPGGNWGKSAMVVSLNGTATDPNGYANSGGFGQIDGAWFFSKHFGIGGIFGYSVYNLKNVDSLSQGYQQSFDVDTTRTTPTNYKIWDILPGLYFNYPITKRFSVAARGLVGIAHATTPQITVTIEDGGVFDNPAIQYPSSKTAFAFDFGAGFSYKVIECLAINLKADYFYTKPDFTITNSARVNNAGREISEYDQPLAAINATLGVAYIFGKK